MSIRFTHCFTSSSSLPCYILRHLPFSNFNRYSTASHDNVNAFRLLMRRFAQPVVIITSGFADGHRAGMTASSFTPVSLTPNPVISFNIKIPSRTANAIQQSNRVIVHLLSSSIKKHSEWASLLAKQKHQINPLMNSEKNSTSVEDLPGSNRTQQTSSHSLLHPLHPIDVSLSKEGLPCLVDSLGLLHCSIIHSYQVQDHILFVANVERVEHGSSPLESSSGLVYYNRNYCSTSPLSPIIDSFES
ncbi:NAD reductase Coq12 [Schizosaccharomyces pombe]|uniref:NAD reductase coq12 n=1 Tax=Schizosaccharomyces pombe (strain 972 / ATCC 24843) TaxID=284812 RepID=COQ12_SCHPO|nr:putative NADH-dependent flavin oxidoreductase [Schizosaccharomyces pombe]Q9UTQ4.1 RecName: Full=Uncharacterized protein C1071.11 [Schizosaccharomyces pombe 972h-]CAB59887.1 NADH-dependent flavin oxidoreductase (predicted) [Schizosaccharomyces pombe]|eukprot:NP_594361.1 putative NADH-dependent flavin oxidoreductase [Schizosaccharomyces pombe]